MSSVTQSQQQRSQPGLLYHLSRDVVAVASLGLVLIYIHYFVNPFFRGFYCDDETIRYPYKESTVSSAVCYFVGSGVNVALIFIVEYLNLQTNDATDESLGRELAKNFEIKLYLRNVYCRLVVWFFGAITSELITDLTKLTAGRLRPHFLDKCQPTIHSTQSQHFEEFCRQDESKYLYITNYSCRNQIRDIRLSFLSGHSSYSAYSAIFAVTYLQRNLDVSKFGLIKPAFQVLLLSVALYTGLSRVSDYKHHWQDVLAGLILGTLIAALINAFLWPPFHKTYTKLIRSTSPQSDNGQAGEELNRFSY